MRRSLIMAAALVIASCAWGQTLSAEWSAPTTGAPVEYYEFVVRLGATAVYSDTSHTTSHELTDTSWRSGSGVWTARVAGVDSLGRRGPWSAPSVAIDDDVAADSWVWQIAASASGTLRIVETAGGTAAAQDTGRVDITAWPVASGVVGSPRRGHSE